ncbi:MAG: ABC transporter substrate-binding protein [Acidimicrobiales bacterium]
MPEVPPSPSRGRQVLLVAAILTAVAIMGGACGSSKAASTAATAPSAGAPGSNLPSDEGTPKDGGSIAWGVEAETDSLSPSVGRWALSGHMVASAIFDPLVTLDSDGKTIPYLATAITPDPTNTVWTITLPAGVTFHNGEPLDAAAVVKNLEADKSSIITGKAMLAVTSITATDPLTVQVKVSQPYATFPNLLSSQVGYIAAPAQIDDFHGGDHPIGTGPFVYKEWVKNDHFSATKNPNYWQKGLPHLDQVDFRPVQDAQQRLDELDNGTLDAITTLNPASINDVRDDSSLKHLEYDKGDEIFITLNTETAPFDNPLARQAVAYATDTASYIAEMGQGVYAPANGPYAPGQLGHLDDTGYPPFDLAKAKDLVAQYTAATGQPLSFSYVGASNVDDARAQQLLKSMWEAAGMQVTLQAVKQEDQIISVVLGQYQAADWRNFGQPDPDTDYVWFSKLGIGGANDAISLNMARYANPAIDDALNAARATTDSAARDGDYQTVSRELSSGVPYIWLARVDWMIAANPRVHGYADAANGSLQTLGPKTWIAGLWID